MTLTSGFFDSIASDRVYDAETFSRVFDGLIEEGVFASIGDAFHVTPYVLLSVHVGTGRAWFKGTWTYNDAVLALEFDTAHPTLDRIDVVYLQINKETATRANSFKVKKGTAASTPVAPALAGETADIKEIPIAEVYIRAAATTLEAQDITNLVGLDACPFVQGPLGGVSVESLLTQWEAEWTVWFDAIQGQLTTEAETNLQAQIWDIVGDINPPVVSLLELDSHDHSDYGAQVVTEGIADGAVTAVKIANRSRRIFVPWTAHGLVTSTGYQNYGWGWLFKLTKTDDNDALYGGIQVPSDFSSDWTVYLLWSSALTGAIRVRLDWVYAADAFPIASGSNTSRTLTYIGGLGELANLSMLATDLAVYAGGVFQYKIGREIAHAADTMVGDARILGVMIEYMADS